MTCRTLVGVMCTCVALSGAGVSGQQGGAGEWRVYFGTNGSTKYSPLDHITASNVSHLPANPKSGAAGHPLTALRERRRFDQCLHATGRRWGYTSGVRQGDWQVVWETTLDACSTSNLMTYMHQGTQYIVVAIGSQRHTAEFVALSLQ